MTADREAFEAWAREEGYHSIFNRPFGLSLWQAWKAACARQREFLGAWHPISTAPKDGRKVIVFYTNCNSRPRRVMARWLTDEQAAESDGDDVGLEAGWYECIDNWDDYTEVAIHEGEPTYWMPLPAYPHDKIRSAE